MRHTWDAWRGELGLRHWGGQGPPTAFPPGANFGKALESSQKEARRLRKESLDGVGEGEAWIPCGKKIMRGGEFYNFFLLGAAVRRGSER